MPRPGPLPDSLAVTGAGRGRVRRAACGERPEQGQEQRHGRFRRGRPGKAHRTTHGGGAGPARPSGSGRPRAGSVGAELGVDAKARGQATAVPHGQCAQAWERGRRRRRELFTLRRAGETPCPPEEGPEVQRGQGTWPRRTASWGADPRLGLGARSPTRALCCLSRTPSRLDPRRARFGSGENRNGVAR